MQVNLKLLSRAYGHYVRARIRVDNYSFMPEVELIRKKLSP